MRNVEIIITVNTDKHKDEIEDLLLDGRLDKLGDIQIRIAEGTESCPS